MRDDGPVSDVARVRLEALAELQRRCFWRHPCTRRRKTADRLKELPEEIVDRVCSGWTLERLVSAA